MFGNTPVDVVKTRMQGLEAHKYKNTWDCVAKIAKNEGFKVYIQCHVRSPISLVSLSHPQVLQGNHSKIRTSLC